MINLFLLRVPVVEILASAVTAGIVVALVLVLPFPRAAVSVAPTPGPIDAPTRYSLDAAVIAGRTIVLHWHPQPLVAVDVTQPLVFAGWAIDSAARLPVSAVVAVIDGAATFSTLPDGLRPDVAAAFANRALLRSGFSLRIPPCALGPGGHRIAFRFYAADRRGYFRSSDDVDIVVRPAPGCPR